MKVANRCSKDHVIWKLLGDESIKLARRSKKTANKFARDMFHMPSSTTVAATTGLSVIVPAASSSVGSTTGTVTMVFWYGLLANHPVVFMVICASMIAALLAFMWYYDRYARRREQIASALAADRGRRRELLASDIVNNIPTPSRSSTPRAQWTPARDPRSVNGVITIGGNTARPLEEWSPITPTSPLPDHLIMERESKIHAADSTKILYTWLCTTTIPSIRTKPEQATLSRWIMSMKIR